MSMPANATSDIGFSAEASAAALQKTGGNIQAAINCLMSNLAPSSREVTEPRGIPKRKGKGKGTGKGKGKGKKKGKSPRGPQGPPGHEESPGRSPGNPTRAQGKDDNAPKSFAERPPEVTIDLLIK